MTDEWGRYRLIYEPGGPGDRGIEFTLGGEAELSELAEVFTDFLKANGYQFNYFEVHK